MRTSEQRPRIDERVPLGKKSGPKAYLGVPSTECKLTTGSVLPKTETNRIINRNETSVRRKVFGVEFTLYFYQVVRVLA
jgi:hypothetical protein